MLLWQCYWSENVSQFVLLHGIGFDKVLGLTRRCTNNWVSLQGLSFLAMSTPHVLPDAARNCDAQKPDCIGDAQKVLFYTALVLIAIGISGHITSLESFLEQQKENQTSAQENSEKPKQTPRQVASSLFVVLLAIVGCIALPYIKPWSVRFGIPAICTVVATFLFTTGSCSYKPSGPRPEGSHLTTVCRVFVASASKTFRHLPPNDIQEPYTRSLRFFLSQPRNLIIWSHLFQNQVTTFLHLTELLERIMTSPMFMISTSNYFPIY